MTRHRDAQWLSTVARPGARVWAYGDGVLGYSGTVVGTKVPTYEKLRGLLEPVTYPDRLAVVRRDGTGEEHTAGLNAALLDDAREAWHVFDAHGQLAGGGPPLYDERRARELAAEHRGVAYHGLGAADPDHPRPVLLTRVGWVTVTGRRDRHHPPRHLVDAHTAAHVRTQVSRVVDRVVDRRGHTKVTPTDLADATGGVAALCGEPVPSWAWHEFLREPGWPAYFYCGNCPVCTKTAVAAIYPPGRTRTEASRG